MNNLFNEIFGQGLTTEIIDDNKRFLTLFPNLYRIDLFKNGLDLVLTKIKQGHLHFEIKMIKGWDTNIGCFLTQKKSFFEKTIGSIIQKNQLKIIIRKLSYNVLAHEMAHAIEYESGINLGGEFKAAIQDDMKNNNFPILTLKGEVRRLMIDALIDYPANQHLSELFARYYELLSISRDVVSDGDFSTIDVMNYFVKTTDFINKSFNPLIKNLIDKNISFATNDIVKQVKISPNQAHFSDKVNSFHQKDQGQKSFSKNINSNASWINDFKSQQKLEDKI